MRKISKYIVLIIIVLVLSLTGCSNNTNIENGEQLKSKVKAELSFLDEELIDVMNKLNNISFSNYIVDSKEVPSSSENSNSSSSESSQQSGGEQSQGNDQGTNSNPNNIKVTEMVENPTISADYNNIKWNELQTTLEIFVSSWNTIILDLYKINVNGSDITEFSSYLDALLIAIKNQDKVSALTNAGVLYSYIPRYIDSFEQQSASKDIITTKLHILNAYVGATASNWDYANSEMILAEDFFTNLMNNNEFVKTREYNTYKTYVALKELQNSVKTQDFAIFLIKYKNVMQEIGILD